MIQRFLVSLFTFVYWKHLHYETPNGDIHRYHIIRVKGWRTMLVDGYGRGRMTITPMFRIFKKYL